MEAGGRAERSLRVCRLSGMGSQLAVGVMACVGGKQGASGTRGHLGGVQRGGEVQKGNAGPSCLRSQCLPPPGHAGAGSEGEVGCL